MSLVHLGAGANISFLISSETVTDIKSRVIKDEDKKNIDWLTPTSIDYGSQYSDLLKV